MRKVLSLVGLTAALCLGATSAFAAASLNAGNTTLAAEKIPATGTYTASAVYTAYQTGGPVAETTVIRLALTNAKFGTGTIYLCSANQADQVPLKGSKALTAASASVDIPLVQPLASGTVYIFQNSACGTSGANFLSNVTLSAGATNGSVVTMTTSNQTSAGDANVAASATVLTVKNQFSASIDAVTSKLDFADNMETFVVSGSGLPSTTADYSKAGLTIISDASLNDGISLTGSTACAYTLAAGDSLTIRVEGNFTGISEIGYDNGASTYTITSTDRTNGYATLTLTGNGLKICKSSDTSTAAALFLRAANTTGTPIEAGIREADVTLNGGGSLASGYSRVLIDGKDAWEIKLDATQAVVPYLSTNTGMPTYCMINNSSTLEADVTMDILSSEGETAATGIALGDIDAKETKMFTFNGATVTPKGDDAVSIADTVTGDNTRYSARFNVNAPPNSVFINCIQTDPNGGTKRMVPVLTPDGYATTATWKN